MRQTDPEYIIPTAWSPQTPDSVGGVPSVLVARENNANLGLAIKRRFSGCAASGDCNRIEIYHDITGHSKEKFAEDAVSITSSFRSALYHVVSGKCVCLLRLHRTIARIASHRIASHHSYILCQLLMLTPIMYCRRLSRYDGRTLRLTRRKLLPERVRL